MCVVVSGGVLVGWDVPCLANTSTSHIITPYPAQTPKPNQEYYEVEVELLTGRTHQLRATFAAEGAPMVHDTMYVWHVWVCEWGLGRTALDHTLVRNCDGGMRPSPNPQPPTQNTGTPPSPISTSTTRTTRRSRPFIPCVASPRPPRASGCSAPA